MKRNTTGRTGGAYDAGTDFERRVRDVIRALEPGEVATYGEVAEEAGFPRAARAVGNVLARSEGLPWWRVVSASGRLAPGHEAEHASRLASEGVDVARRKVRRPLGPRVRAAATSDLRADELAALRHLFEEAWPDSDDAFTDDDWDHATGGVHFIVEERGSILAHASVVERELHTNGRGLRAGYVEAVATRPRHQGRGHGTAVMRAAGDHIDRTYELGALATDVFPFYERLGWTRWRGPTSVRTDAGLIRTPEEDGFVLVRLTPSSPPLDLSAPISCDWRAGDVW